MKSASESLKFSLGNRFIERVFSVEGGRFRSVAVVNRRSGAGLDMDSEEFRLVFLDGSEIRGAEFAHRDHGIAESADGANSLTVRLNHPPTGLTAVLTFTLGRDDFFVRKQIALSADRQTEGHLDRLDVESFATESCIDAVSETQPIFIAGECFLGLEYPAGVHRVEGTHVRVSHFPGVRLSRTPWHSKKAVLGVTATRNVHGSFLEYVDRIRRKKPQYLKWNSGGDFQVYDPVQLRKQSLGLLECVQEIIATLQTELTVKRGIPVKIYELEPSWHNPDTLYEVERTKFPRALREVTEPLSATSSYLGLWLSPTPPLCPILLRKEALAKLGYQAAVNPNHPGEYPCLSSQPYFRDIKETMCRHVRELGVRDYKMDFSFLDCEGDGHGHLPSRRHGREANLDAMIELMTALHAAQPDISTLPTSGMWLSPWWLMYADVLWPHGMVDFNYDRGPVSVNPRDWELTLRDQEFHRLFRVERCRFPFSGVMQMAMGGGPRYNIAGPNESRESYLRTIVYETARQLKCRIRYVDAPPSRLEEDWDAVAQLHRWAMDRHDELPEGRMILGEPTTGAVYGFSYLKPDGGIVALRNPSMLPQTARIPLDGVADDLELAAQITYPYRQWLGAGGKTELAARMNVELGPHDVMVVETTPLRSHREPILAGCRYALASLEPGLMVCDVFTDAGEPVAFEILGSATVTGLDVEGQRVSGEGKRCLLPPDGAPQPLLIFRLPDRTGEERDVVGRVDHVPLQTVRLDIPDEHEAVLRILTDDTKLHPPKVSVNSGGLFGGLPYGVCTGRGWTAYDLRLNPRDMNVVAWGFPKSDSPPNAKLWLLREWDLKRTRVRISYAAGGGNAMRPHLPTPFAGRQHEALCISDVLPAVTDKRPWTDEYAREASG